MDRLLTLNEAAKRLGITRAEAVQLIRARRLRVIQAGRSFVIRVKMSEIERQMKERENGVVV